MCASWSLIECKLLGPTAYNNPVGKRLFVKTLAYLWASPYTVLGLLLGGLGLCTGSRVQMRRGVIEFYGGGLKWLIEQFPGGPFMAFTLGHTVTGLTDAALDLAREHELVHVRQFEIWGPFMGPAYLLCSLYLWLTGGRPYRDNPFERQAYALGGGD